MLPVPRLYYVDDRIINDCIAVAGMRIGRGKINPPRKPTPVAVCAPQIPHDLSRAAEVGSLSHGMEHDLLFTELIHCQK
jgi:hypothetical protein